MSAFGGMSGHSRTPPTPPRFSELKQFNSSSISQQHKGIRRLRTTRCNFSKHATHNRTLYEPTAGKRSERIELRFEPEPLGQIGIALRTAWQSCPFIDKTRTLRSSRLPRFSQQHRKSVWETRLSEPVYVGFRRYERPFQNSFSELKQFNRPSISQQHRRIRAADIRRLRRLQTVIKPNCQKPNRTEPAWMALHGECRLHRMSQERAVLASEGMLLNRKVTIVRQSHGSLRDLPRFVWVRTS